MGDGWASPFSPSLLSKKKKAIRHPRHHHDYICDDVMFRLLRNNIPMDFFLKRRHALICADRPTGRSRGLQTTTMEDVDAAVMFDMLASAPEMVASSHAGNDARISTACIPLALCGQPSTTTVTHINT